MSARIPLPYFLAKSAFATSSATEFGISRGRMRAMDLDAPFRGENRRRWRGDFERVCAFQEAGWTVIRVNADDLADERRRAALIVQLRGLLS